MKGRALSCLIHPDSGITYCTTGAECPASTTWNATTQACKPQVISDPPGPFCKPIGVCPGDIPVEACQVTIAFAPANPSSPTLQSSGPCDAAGIELAVAVMLAKLLGAR